MLEKIVLLHFFIKPWKFCLRMSLLLLAVIILQCLAEVVRGWESILRAFQAMTLLMLNK